MILQKPAFSITPSWFPSMSTGHRKTDLQDKVEVEDTADMWIQDDTKGMSWENNLVFLPSWCKLLSLQVWSCCSLWNLQKSKSYCSSSSFHSSPSAPSAAPSSQSPPWPLRWGNRWPNDATQAPVPLSLALQSIHANAAGHLAAWWGGVKHLAFSPAKRHCFKSQGSLWKIAIRNFICDMYSIYICIYIYVWIEVIPIFKHEAPTSMSLSSLAARQRWSLGSEGAVGQVWQNLKERMDIFPDDQSMVLQPG